MHAVIAVVGARLKRSVRRQLALGLSMALAIVAFGQGCSRAASNTAIPVSSLPPELQPLPGADHLSAHREPRGYVSVSYQLNEAYPAERTLRALRERLESNGWSPLANDWLNPTQPSSHSTGWGNFDDAVNEPKGMVDQWLAQWRNGAGEIVLYELRYVSPSQSFARSPDQPDNTVLRVTGMLASASLAARMTQVFATDTPSSQ